MFIKESYKGSAMLMSIDNKELGELYASVAIRFFALAMIGVFTPIYLIKLGYSLPAVAGFFGLVAVFHGGSVFLAGWLSSKYGLKHTILISIFLIFTKR